MFFTVEKFQRRVEELGRRRYFGMRCIAPFAAVPGTLGEDEHYHGAPPEIISAIQEPPVTEFGLHDFFVGGTGISGWKRSWFFLRRKKAAG